MVAEKRAASGDTFGRRAEWREGVQADTPRGDDAMRLSRLAQEEWTRINGIFSHALALDEAARTAFLDEACEDDVSLRSTLEELLDADAAAESALGEHASDVAAELIEDLWATAPSDPREDLEDLAVGARIGPYRVLRGLGGGGMGRVYLAERADGQFEKRVALKVVRRGMDTDELLRRFLQERQILASLDHPGIARLLDGGVAPDGRPFLVMDYVDGRTLDRWIREERPLFHERLRLFVRVCDAVQHAHRRLVVHRDLKPSNLLVTRKGDPRLLDFGIARLLSADAGAPRTRTGVRLVTPEVAAPEQFRGEDSGTAIDVHGLGALLYFLITERTPYGGALRTGDPAEPPPAPASTNMADPSLSRLIRGDVDVILAKALHPDPERRYGSATELGEDVRRHLEGRPIEARRDSLRYRFRKFVGRNRRSLAASAAALLVLGLLGSAAVRERMERSREAQAGLAVSQFLEDLFEASDPMATRGERLDTLPVFALLDRGLERIDTELADNPRARARLLHTLGTVYMNSGAAERGESLIREAVALRRSNGEPRETLGASLVQLGRASLELGRPVDAEAPLREALGLGDRLDPADRAAALVNLAVVHQERGQLRAADSLYRQALEGFRAIPETEERQGNVLSNLAYLSMSEGDFDSALPLVREALEHFRAALPEGHPMLSRGLNNLAVVLRRTGDLEGAERLYREALESFSARLRSPHPMLAIASMNLATTVALLGRPDEAESLMLASVDEARGAFPPDHPDRGAILARAADFYVEQAAPSGGETAPRDPTSRAEGLAREALDAFTAALGPEHVRTADAHRRLGTILLSAGRQDAAEPHLISSWAILEQAASPPSDLRARVATGLIELYEALGVPERADPYRPAAAPPSPE